MKKDKRKQLTELMEKINRSGKKKLTGDKRKVVWGTEVSPVELVPVGLLTYDNVVGGEPKGRWTIDYGMEGSGKSSWNYRKIAIFQSMGLVCAVIDAEDGFDLHWATAQGVDAKSLVMIPSQENFEDTCGHVRQMVASRLIDFYLLDSIHGIAMKGELYKKASGTTAGKERSLSDDTQALGPRKIGQFIRSVGPVLGKSKAMFTIIGQAREKISPYGGGIDLTGGHQLKHHAACIRQWSRAKKDLWPVRKVNNEDALAGFSARVRIQKTKLNANEGQDIIIPFLYGLGVAEVQANVEVAILRGVVENVSSTYYQWGDKKINGRNATYTFFEQKPEEYAKLMEMLDGRSRDSQVAGTST